MEPHRRIGGFRTLLPYEVGLCESLGITEKEYFEFLDLTEAYFPERKKEYDHVPNIVNMPQVALPGWMVAAGGGLSAWGQIAIGIALTSVSYALTPKPKDPSQAPRLQIGGVQGRSRFTPVSGFDSVQDLASLGSFIPLVYAKQGVRVASQLLWSQIRTAQYGEIINAIVLFSNGEIAAKPQFESLALGEVFLADLAESKLKVYFSRGARETGRLKGVADTQTPSSTDDQYQEGSAKNSNNYGHRGNREYDDSDPFMVKLRESNQFVYKPSFSSTKTPSTNSSFGVYSPMPNGNAYKVNWELILLAKDADDGIKKDLRIKMGKLAHSYPRQIGLTSSSYSNGQVLNPNQVQPGLLAYYRLFWAVDENAFIDTSVANSDATKKWTKFSPWGSSDAYAVSVTNRENADDAISVGEQYMVGSTLMTAIQEDNGNQWTKEPAFGFQKAITLKADEPGYIEFRNHGETQKPYESLIVQKVELATFSNTRRSDITQVGLKSTVWRRINGFPNVNEMPSQDRIASYEKKNGSIQIGQVSKYVKRLSFFKIQAKKLNSGDKFIDIGNTVICVKGSAPVPQYNSIDINHFNPSQYEFRFLPVAGNVVLNYYQGQVHVLDYAAEIQQQANYDLGLKLVYHAKVENLPSGSGVKNGNYLTNNPEWDRGGYGGALADTDPDVTGPVETFQPSFSGVEVVDEDLQWSWDTVNNGQGQFYPPNRTTYYGNGLNNDPNQGQPLESQHTNVSNYNYKGTPAVGNSYFSPEKGIVAYREEIKVGNSIRYRWTYSVGGTLIPNGEAVSYDRASNVTPAFSEDDWTDPVEMLVDSPTGMVASGIWHRFRVAVNPSSWGGKGDWRQGSAQAGAGRNHFAVAIQRANKRPPTITFQTYDAAGGSGSGMKVLTKITTDGTRTKKEYSLIAGGSGYKNNETVTVDGYPLTVQVASPTIAPPETNPHDDWRKDGTLQYYLDYWEITRHNPNNAIADYFLFDSETSSHENGPEHEVTHVNEIIHAGPSSSPQINYEHLAIAGIRVGATNTLSSFNSFSAFIEQGIIVDRLINDSGSGLTTRNSLNAATDNFVEIAHDLLTNTSYGAGDIVGHDGVDRASMIEGAKYCKANNFHWNGIIDRQFNLREFIFEHANYNFLDFSILGGRFSLRPSFPINGDYTINYDASVNSGINVRALFTDGNMRNIKATFLTPEERKMFKATVIYRDDRRNEKGIGGFPENIAKTYAYNPTGEAGSTFYPKAEQLPEEVFDLSNWCTDIKHAKLFAAIALSTRKEVDHGITFETPPNSVFGLLAGDYIRVLTEATHTSRFNNGSIDSEGYVTSRATISGSINTYCWTPGTLGGIEEKTFSVGSDGKNSLGLTNKLFAQVDSTTEDRIYKVESITYGEEGFIQIAASHAPLINDKLAVLYHANPDSSVNGVNFLNRFPELRGL